MERVHEETEATQEAMIPRITSCPGHHCLPRDSLTVRRSHCPSFRSSTRSCRRGMLRVLVSSRSKESGAEEGSCSLCAYAPPHPPSSRNCMRWRIRFNAMTLNGARKTGERALQNGESPHKVSDAQEHDISRDTKDMHPARQARLCRTCQHR